MKELRETRIYRYEHLIYASVGALGLIVLLVLDKAPFLSGMMVGFTFTNIVMWAIRYQDLVQWRRNQKGLHFHDGRLWKLQRLVDDK